MRIIESIEEARAFIVHLRGRGTGDPEIVRGAEEIVEQVRRGGDEALVELTGRLDGWRPASAADLRCRPDELEAAWNSLPADQRELLERITARLFAFHRRDLPESWIATDAEGAVTGTLCRPLARAAVYAPGGRAAYPSSVLMSAIPALAAGVGQVVVTSPTPGGEVNPATLGAAHLLGLTEVYRIGGAQAVAALAYGTETIRPVDKIVGPGNAWVTAAKARVFGAVDIDMLAGPSEILIVSDGAGEADTLAADLLSQAEHDPLAGSVLITTSAEQAQAVSRAVESRLARLPREEIARRAVEDQGAVILVEGREEAVALANELAPEHLEIAAADPWEWIGSLDNAGALFVGHNSPEPMGDYVAGPSHVLPTGGTARFFSPLGSYDFFKRTSLVFMSRASLERLGPDAAKLARMEEFEGHALSVEARTKGPK